MPKTYAAPPPPPPPPLPPISTNLKGINFEVKDSKDKRCIIVKSSYGDIKKNNINENNNDKSDKLNSVIKNEKLLHKNRFYFINLIQFFFDIFRPNKLEIVEPKIETNASPNSIYSFNNNTHPLSPNSIYNNNNYQKNIINSLAKPNDIRAFNSLAKLSPKLERLQEHENELSYYEFEVIF